MLWRAQRGGARGRVRRAGQGRSSPSLRAAPSRARARGSVGRLFDVARARGSLRARARGRISLL